MYIIDSFVWIMGDGDVAQGHTLPVETAGQFGQIVDDNIPLVIEDNGK